MPRHHNRLTIAAAAFIPIAFFAANPAKAALINVNATWSGANEPTPNSALTVAQLAFDTASYLFDAGGPLGHEWWYYAWSTTGVAVSGSTMPAANGLFSKSAFDWLLIDSSAATPELALISPGLQMMLGANGSDLGPSVSGLGEMVVGSGGASSSAERVLFTGLTAVPEPAAFAIGLLCLGAGIASRRRRVWSS